MDYCSSCRRHLNGALVCPGCGAYAPDIAPPRTDGHRHGQGHGPAGGWFAAERPLAEVTAAPPADVTAALPAEPAADVVATSPTGDVVDAPPAPQGRAARRRQRARWKKSQRRAVVATAVALVGGGLTLASMDRGSGDRAQASSAPDNRSMGLTEEPSAAPSQAASTPDQTAGTHRHTPTTPSTPSTRTVAVNTPRQQSLAPTPYAARSAGHPHTVAVDSHPAAPAAPAAPSHSSTPSTSTSTDTGTGSSGTTAQPAPSTGTSSGSSSTTPSTPSTGSTSHDQLCLVLVCLG
ncbi:hypothetical protein AB0L75_05495 [Streptomyces sp. NPDC052101]|uniref:SCO2400 family protein n=1 Tax=Streptomyces sp. NPDC052101 TaxID=3155763 RepID=UPI00343A82C9